MRLWTPEMPPLVERANIEEIYADGIADVEVVGACIKFSFYSTQRAYDGTLERVVVLKIVRPVESLSPGRALVLKALAESRPELLPTLALMQ